MRIFFGYNPRYSVTLLLYLFGIVFSQSLIPYSQTVFVKSYKSVEWFFVSIAHDKVIIFVLIVPVCSFPLCFVYLCFFRRCFFCTELNWYT